MQFASKLRITILSLLLIAGLVVISFVSYWGSSMMKDQIILRLESTAFHRLNRVDRFLTERFEELSMVSRHPVLKLNIGVSERIKSFLETSRDQSTYFQNFTFYSLDRQAVASVGEYVDSHSTLNLTPDFWSQMETRLDHVVFEFIFDKELRRPLIHFGKKIQDADAESYGYLVGVMPVEMLNPVLATGNPNDPLTEYLQVDLFNQSGKLLYSNKSQGGILLDNVSYLQSLRNFDQKTQSFSEVYYDEIEEKEYLIAMILGGRVLDLGQEQWRLALRIPTGKAFLPIDQLKKIFYLFYLL